MKRLELALCVSLLCASTAALAAEAQTDVARDQRMSEALERYRESRDHGDVAERNMRMRDHGDRAGHGHHARDHDPRNPDPGPAARAEIRAKHGARKVGHSVKHGLTRAAEAVSRAGDKVAEKVDPRR